MHRTLGSISTNRFNLYLHAIYSYFFMKKLLFPNLILLLIPLQLLSQIFPKEGGVLNYRLIGFRFNSPQIPNSCTVEIASGYLDSDSSFSRNIIKSERTEKNKLIIEVPSFDTSYTWRVIYNGSNPTRSKLFHFRTGSILDIDTNINRLRILKKAEKYKDAYFFVDENKALYDMNGRPVWYLPNSGSKNAAVRDLKISPQGSITYEIDEIGVFEINYNGEKIWKGPNNGAVSGDSIEHYHHEFTRLKNGHYMALAQEIANIRRTDNIDTTLLVIPLSKIKPGEIDNVYMRQPMGTLIEYDQNGKVIWSWKSSDHFNGTTFLLRKTNNGFVQMHAHENSFFFDEQTSSVYLSFRNLDRIIKIKYPEGNIIAIYGESDKTGKGFFCGQHSLGKTTDGFLFLYNNNVCNKSELSSIELLKEPATPDDTMKKVWEYECGSEIINANGYPSGGSVSELPDQSFFVSMAYPESRIFIINYNTDILWCARAERKNLVSKQWAPVLNYKASLITDRKTLENLIWNTELK